MTYRTASYADAKKALHKPDEDTASTYRGATTKSQAFFRKMGESHAEAERLRLQCRSAANASTARNQEEKVALSHIKKTIEEARAVSSYAQAATTKDAAYRMEVFTGAGEPMWLGHLADPKHWEQKEPAPKAPLAILPGIADSPAKSEARDVDLQISEALLSGRTGSKSGEASVQKEPDSGQKLPPVQSGDSNSVPEAATAPAPEAAPAAEACPVKEENASSRGSRKSESEDGNEVVRDDSDEDEEESFSSGYEDSDASDAWPPSPPVLRFKMRMQFSDRFRPSGQENQKQLFEKANQDLEAAALAKYAELHLRKLDHPIVEWLNERFSMILVTEYQLEVGFAVIMLTMLDAIYAKRVRWREADWRFQYNRALQRNYALLEGIWAEVNMEKAREFRMENTPLRLENMPTCSVAEKLEFLRLMKRWYDQRIHHAGPYDPMAKRQEFVDQCKGSGHTVKFPNWMKFNKDHKVEISEEDAREQNKTQEYNKMPEYKRLIHFLGCQEYQTM